MLCNRRRRWAPLGIGLAAISPGASRGNELLAMFGRCWAMPIGRKNGWQVAEQLGEANGLLIVDETGFLKNGAKSCGVARQYTGTAGRIENAQGGRVPRVRDSHGACPARPALYLPKEWAGNDQRRKEAGVPAHVELATMLVLARQLIDRAMAAGVQPDG